MSDNKSDLIFANSNKTFGSIVFLLLLKLPFTSIFSLFFLTIYKFKSFLSLTTFLDSSSIKEYLLKICTDKLLLEYSVSITPSSKYIKSWYFLLKYNSSNFKLDFKFKSFIKRLELILNENSFSVSIDISFFSKKSKLKLTNFENELGFIKPFLLLKSPLTSKFFPGFEILIFFDWKSILSYLKLILSKLNIWFLISKLKLILLTKVSLSVFNLALFTFPVTS